MKEKTFEFLVQLINSKQIGDTFKRLELINMLIAYYKPSPYDKKNSSIRTAPSIILVFFVNQGYVERIKTGSYKILKHVQHDKTYKDICKKVKS